LKILIIIIEFLFNTFLSGRHDNVYWAQRTNAAHALLKRDR